MKYIIITGVSTGIGYGAVETFTRHGYSVIGGVRKESDAQRLKQDFGEAFTPLIWDVTLEEHTTAAVARIQEICQNQEITALINNAGISYTGPLMHMPMAEVRKQFEVNVLGLVAVTKALLPLLIKSKQVFPQSGRIVNISSVGGKVAMPFIAPYVGTKFAVEGISHALRRELRPYGLEVIIIGPGAVKTRIFDKQFTSASPDYQDTDYVDSLAQFKQMAAGAMEKALNLQEFGEKLVQIVESSHPKRRYAIVKGRLLNYDLLRLMPHALLDRMVGKMLKL